MPRASPRRDTARERALELRRARHGIEEIVGVLSREGTPLSRTAAWEVLKEEGHPDRRSGHHDLKR